MDRRSFLLAGFGVVVLSAPALGHGPSRQKVRETVEIDAPADKVWAAIGAFHDMSWHPAVQRTDGSGGNGPGAKRTLALPGGGIIEEELEKYDGAARSYTYRITAVDPKVLPVTNYVSTLTVTPNADGKRSTVEWRGAFYRGYPNNDPPPDQNDEAAVKAVTGVYRAGLDALKTKLDGAGA